MEKVTRRKFITTAGALAAALPLGAAAFDFVPSAGESFHFVLLGDLHFDKLAHHDMEYVKSKYPNDIQQIENYSRITRDNLPGLLKVAKEKGVNLNADFYLQLGDFVEGLCGSESLAQQQTREFISLVADQRLNRPFFVTKGNHDITGEGAKETYQRTVLPWQSKELAKPVPNANATFVHKNARFVMFDCFTENESLDWLKEVLAEHREELLFFCIHYPVVPFNARSTWHVFAKPHQQTRREELLNLLGQHRAIVLCGHLHKTNLLTRNTPRGNFVQVCLGSVIPAPTAPVQDHLRGIQFYKADLVNREPDFSPSTLQERRAVLEKEASHVKHYEYADCCGYATVIITSKSKVMLSIFVNADKTPWTTVDLAGLFQV
ncbi:MAG: metallophosphoesterase [Ferruginibacter sp.]|nr:metallophosphoesterase [Cytophagales bacterium]